MPRQLLLLSLGIGALCISFAACAASQAAAPDTTGAGGAAASTAGTGTTSIGGGFAAASGSGGMGGFGGGCVGTSTKANPIPLDIFVMLDQSGSMNLDAGNGMTRWQMIQAAFTSFVQQADVSGIAMGIQYFGLPDPSVHGCAQQSCLKDGDCTGGCTTCMPEGVCESAFNPDIDSCEAVDYAWAEIPIQSLPGVGNTIVTSIASHAPGTNTPTSPALEGAIDYAAAWEKKNPTHITVVAFATDGEPSECDTDLGNIDAIAAAGFGAVPSIKTFVIGVGSAISALDGIAAAGGTTSAFHTDTNAMATLEFVAAMNTIRTVAIACTYQLPPPPQGKMEDFGLVNVSYTPGAGGAAQTFSKVQSKADCPANGDAWYYDSEASPTEIILCNGTCNKLATDLKAEVDVVFGCQTILK